MTDRPDWDARRSAWEAQRLGPAAARAPERRTRFSTISDAEVERLYGPWSWQHGAGGPTEVDHHGDPLRPDGGDGRLGRVRSRPRRRAARGAPVHPRHPPDRLPQPALDDAHVRRLRRGRGHQRALPPAAAGGPDRPVDRLRHADPVRLRHRRSRGRGRVRHVRRRGQLAGRHGGPARRAAARPRSRPR